MPTKSLAAVALAFSGCYTIRYDRRGALPEDGTPEKLAASGGWANRWS